MRLSTRAARALSPLAAAALACASAGAQPAPARSSHADLVAFFAEWRAFQKPRLVGGVPDYTAAAMAAQHAALSEWQKRLAAFDTSGWTVAQQDDVQIVRAELNGLDFDHRVLRPWERIPAFYANVFDEKSDQPAREGPVAAGAIELWKLPHPLTAEAAAELAGQLESVPALLAQAKRNLTGDGRDFWVHSDRTIGSQRKALAALAPELAAFPAAQKAAQDALAATESFAAWVAEQAKSKSGHSGIGVQNYDWYLANVQLLPYTWADEVALMERELARARASLALEEQRNRALPELAPVASADEHARRFNAAIDAYAKFLAEHDIVTVEEFMAPALRAEIGRFHPGPLEFFTEVDYREPLLMRTHGYHWIDLAWMQRHPHPNPIRRGALLYNIFDSRTEGFATALEEIAMQEVLVEGRARELVYILVAQRAARALGDLKMHANQLSLDEAARFASKNTPRGWLRPEGQTVWFEQFLYLTQPAYGTSYLMGKIEFDKLLGERAAALGAGFSVRKVLDAMNEVGLIPMPLVRRELAQ